MGRLQWPCSHIIKLNKFCSLIYLSGFKNTHSKAKWLSPMVLSLIFLCLLSVFTFGPIFCLKNILYAAVRPVSLYFMIAAPSSYSVFNLCFLLFSAKKNVSSLLSQFFPCSHVRLYARTAQCKLTTCCSVISLVQQSRKTEIFLDP